MKHRALRLLAFLLHLLLLNQMLPAQQADGTSPGKLHAYFGTYTDGDSKGLYHAVLDCATGKLSEPELVGEVGSPSFIAIHPSGKYLYSVSKEGKDEGGVATFAIDGRTGKLRAVGKQAFSGGGPCYLAVEHIGKCLLAANFHGGRVAALPINTDGTLADAACVIQHEGSSDDPARQKAPHPHSIVVDPSNRFAIVPDLGIDQLVLYELNAQGAKLEPHNPPTVAVKRGGGPRHFVFHPNRKFAFANNELTASVMAFAFDSAKGDLKHLQTLSTLPTDFTGRKSTAEIQVHPNGRFLYVSNRGHESIAIFAVDPDSGQMTAVGHQPTGGKEPRNFCIEPNGKYLVVANQTSSNVVVFEVDGKTGLLKPTGSEITVPSPACVRFLPN